MDFEEPMKNEDIKQEKNIHKVPYNPIPNDEQWGLGEYKLNKVTLNNIKIKKKTFKKKVNKER